RLGLALARAGVVDMVWCMRTILKSLDSIRLISLQPLVPRPTADLEAPADLGHAPFLALALFNELQSLFHHCLLLPSHTSLIGDRQKNVNSVVGELRYHS